MIEGTTVYVKVEIKSENDLPELDKPVFAINANYNTVLWGIVSQDDFSGSGYICENNEDEVLGDVTHWLKPVVIQPSYPRWVMEQISNIRDEMYEELPTGDTKAWDLLKIINKAIRKLDDLVEAVEKSRENQGE